MAASNTKECFRECVGRRVVGVLFDALPASDRSLAVGTKTLVFDDGTGLTITSQGTFWRGSAIEVVRAIGIARRELEARTADLAETLKLAGESV